MISLAIAGIDKDLIDALRGDPRYRIVAVFDPAPVASACEIPVLGGDEAFAAWARAHPDARYAMAVDVPAIRRRLVEREYAGAEPATIVCAGARVAPDASLGRGTIVQRGAYVSSGARVGAFCKLNVDAAVHHDCAVGDFATLAPGCRLLGNVRVGTGAYIGASATVLPRVDVGAGARVGAGAVVVRDAPDGATLAGVPARIMGDENAR
ncbi:MAG: NeuD/PglB/VioB family sugar acetyltransferase [Tagaea sp.]|nr:NeuD/PglB/VioB family sugar acetyltransferase [Tagaea sp.]